MRKSFRRFLMLPAITLEHACYTLQHLQHAACWKSSEKVRCVLLKIYVFSEQHIQLFKFLFITFCKILIFQQNRLKICFGIFTKISLQLRKFSMHIVQ